MTGSGNPALVERDKKSAPISIARADNILSEHNERTESRRRDKTKKKQQSKAAKYPQLRRPYLSEIASYQVHTLIFFVWFYFTGPGSGSSCL